MLCGERCQQNLFYKPLTAYLAWHLWVPDTWLPRPVKTYIRQRRGTSCYSSFERAEYPRSGIALIRLANQLRHNMPDVIAF